MHGAQSPELREAAAALRPYWATAAGFGLVSSVLLLAPSIYMLEVYGRVVNSRSLVTLGMLTVAVLGAFVLLELLDGVRARFMQQAQQVLDHRLGERVFAASFAANLRRLPSGSPQTLGDLRTVREFLVSPLPIALMDAPGSALFLAVLFAMHPLLGVASLAGACLQLLIVRGNDRATREPLLAANKAATAAQRYADGAQRNAQAVAAMGMARDVHRRWNETQGNALAQQALAAARAGTYQALSRFLQVTTGSLLLGLGAWLVVRNSAALGAGMIIVGSILGVRVLAPMLVIVAQWRTVLQARDAWMRLDALLEAVPASAPAMPLPPPAGRLQAENVSAVPPGQAVPVLRGISFALDPGEVLAVLGPTGAGKSSLARLLVGVWSCSAGKVRLDGADVHAWPKEELGPFVGYLPQEVALFDGTLADNIARFGVPDPAKLHAAANAAGLHEIILGLRNRYEERVGSDGLFLCGGHRQRVGLARALYDDPVLVVLDEPNASLDEAGDAALAAAIVSLKARGSTCVVITQRTGVLALADKLLVLRDGQMQAFGPREEVLAALHQAAATPPGQLPGGRSPRGMLPAA